MVKAGGMGLVRSVAGARVRRDACEAGVGRDIARDSASRRVACRGESFLAKLFLSTNMDLPSELACAAGDGSSRGKLACACTRGEARDGARIASRCALCVARLQRMRRACHNRRWRGPWHTSRQGPWCVRFLSLQSSIERERDGHGDIYRSLVS